MSRCIVNKEGRCYKHQWKGHLTHGCLGQDAASVKMVPWMLMWAAEKGIPHDMTKPSPALCPAAPGIWPKRKV